MCRVSRERGRGQLVRRGGAGDPGVGGADTSWLCRIIQEFMPMTHESSPYEYAPQRFALAPQVPSAGTSG